MDISKIIEKKVFFDFEMFRTDITKHFKDNAHLLDLTADMVISNPTEMTAQGLVIEVYLDEDNPLIDEATGLHSLNKMPFVIDVFLLGEGNFTNEIAFNELMKRTQILSAICRHLNLSLKGNYNGTFVLANNIKLFSTVERRNSDNLNNACKIFGWFSAYKEK
jgi:hypothetical protein